MKGIPSNTENSSIENLANKSLMNELSNPLSKVYDGIIGETYILSTSECKTQDEKIMEETMNVRNAIFDQMMESDDLEHLLKNAQKD